MVQGKVYRGAELKKYIDASGILLHKNRDCLESVTGYLRGREKRVLALCGAKGTGKTTLICRAIENLGDYEESVLIAGVADPEMTGLEEVLSDKKSRYIFIDEVTSRMPDLLKDAVSEGRRVVLTCERAEVLYAEGIGTDILNVLPTDYIPFREYRRLVQREPELSQTVGKTDGLLKDYLRFKGKMWDLEVHCAHRADGGDGTGEKAQESAVGGLGEKAVESATERPGEKAVESATERPGEEAVESATGGTDETAWEENDEMTRELFENAVLEPFTGQNWNALLALAEDCGADTQKLETNVEFGEKIFKAGDAHREKYVPKLRAETGIGTGTYDVTQPGIRFRHLENMADRFLSEEEFQDFSPEDMEWLRRLLLARISAVLQEKVILFDLSRDPAVSGQTMISSYQSDGGELFDLVLVHKRTRRIVVMQIRYTSKREESVAKYLTDISLRRELEDYFGGKIAGRYILYNGRPGTAYGVRYAGCEEFLARGAVFGEVLGRLLG